MNISISIDELKRLLTAMPTDQNIMLTGRHGIGKSEILTNFYAERGMKVVTLFLGQMSDPGDLIGLPNKNEQTGKTDFMPPYWFPMDGEPIVLFLDELNRARPEVLQTVMDLVLNRKLAGRQLPKGSVIISAVNEGDEYQLTDLDPALVSRFNIYQFRPTTAEWLLWAQENGLDERVIFFISNNADWLDENIKQADRVSSSLYQFWLTFLSVLVRSVTQFLDKCSVDQVLMSFSLTFTMRSLKLIVFVTDSFETFGYNGIVRTKDVTPYSLFGDFLLL